MTKSRNLRPPRTPWSETQLALLRAQYADHKTSDLALAVDHTVGQVYQKAAQFGLKKSAEFIREDGRRRASAPDAPGAEYRWPRGHVPANKGLRRPGYAPGRMAATQFKPGHRGGKAAALYQPIGAERISKDGYRERKINDDMPLQKRWRAVHLLVWEAVNGPLPASHVVVFRDGDKTNIVLANLELISRVELMQRNTRHRLPKELANLIALRGALNRQINKRTKNEQ